MTTEEFRNTMKNCQYIDYHSDLQSTMCEYSEDARKITFEMNACYHTQDELRKYFSELIGMKIDDSFRLFPPFYTDCGKNISVGKDVFINSCCCFQDQGGIEIGDGVFIGQQVVIATLNHDFAPDKRGNMIPKRVKIGNRVWIGAHVTICPGVTVGDNSVIGAGAVVTHDVPENAVVAGVPAKVIKLIGETK